MLNRAYSLIEIKAVDEEKRIIEGIATTPNPDRVNDIVELDGIEFKLPLPFLYQHNARQPIGNVIEAKRVKGEMRVKIQLAASGIAQFIDEAWGLIKAGLVRGLSIGFKVLEEAYNRETGGFRYIRTEWIELSAVTIPMNSEATITAVKSADALVMAASGRGHSVVRLADTSNTPGVTGTGRTSTTTMTIKEQIEQFQAKRGTHVARMEAIMKKAGDEGRTLDATESQEYDGLDAEIKAIDEHLLRLTKHEQTIISRATPVDRAQVADAAAASAARGGTIQVRSNLPKGTTFSRYVMALAHAKGNHRDAIEIVKERFPDMPELQTILRAAVAAGNTTDATWASPLVPAAQAMQGEFLELLRPATIVGRIPGLRRVPFNISMPTQSGGGTYGWVGEGAAKPVSALSFGSATLRWAKVAGIIVLTKELVKFSNPSAEAIVRDDMIKGTAQFIDSQFIDPTVAEVTNVSPASITNGVAPTAASGTTAAAFRTDMKAVMATFITANDNPMDAVVLMSATVALNLSLLVNSLGQKEFPDLSLAGGSILGLPVIVSQAVGNRIILVKANEILLADDGPVEIDVSEEASVVMDSNPQASPQTTELVSFWQRNYIGLRVDKFINYKKARTTSVAYISNAAYGG